MCRDMFVCSGRTWFKTEKRYFKFYLSCIFIRVHSLLKYRLKYTEQHTHTHTQGTFINLISTNSLQAPKHFFRTVSKLCYL